MIAATAAALALKPESRDARMLVASGGAIVAIAPDSTRTPLLADAQDAAYSPDGTMIAFARSGDLWDRERRRHRPAQAHVHAERRGMGAVVVARRPCAGLQRKGRRPASDQDRAAADGTVRARCTEQRRRVEPRLLVDRAARIRLDTRRHAGDLRCGAPTGTSVVAFDTTTPAVPPADVRDLAWSPDGKRLAYTQRGSRRDDVARRRRRDDAGRSDDDTRCRRASGVVADGNAHRVRRRRRQPPFDRGRRHRPARARRRPAARLATSSRSASRCYPNLVQRPPSGLVVTRRRARTLAARLHVDGRQPRAGHPADPGHAARPSHGDERATARHARGRRERASCPSRASCTTRSRRPTTTGTSSASTAMSCGARAPTSCSCAITRAGSASRTTTASRRAFRTARRASSRTAHSSTRARASSRRARPSATPTGIRRTSTARTSTSRKVPAGNYWLVHRANSDFHLRETHYGDDAASLLVRITWPGGHRAAPTVSTLRVCSQERC